MSIFKQGAEARLTLGEYKNQECLIKERFVKNYRHPDLDTHLTKERMRAESKAISRCQSAGIFVPKVFNVDFDNRKIYMEYFAKSITAKQFINDVLPKVQDAAQRENKLTELAKEIGTIVAKMHTNNLIHGDLTSSNFLLNPTNDDDGSFASYQIVLIDFGLSSYGQSSEHKGVDLYVLERALLSTHSAIPNLFDIVLDAYTESNPKNFKETIGKYKDVRARGRKRTMVG